MTPAVVSSFILSTAYLLESSKQIDSNMPIYAGWSSVNVTLGFLCIATKSFWNVFVAHGLVLMSISSSLLCYSQDLHQFYFVRFPLFYHIHHSLFNASFNSHNDFSSLLPSFLLLFVFMCWIWHMVLAIVFNWIVAHYFCLVLIQVSNKTANSHNGASTFFFSPKMLGTNFLTLPTGILKK